MSVSPCLWALVDLVYLWLPLLDLLKVRFGSVFSRSDECFPMSIGSCGFGLSLVASSGFELDLDCWRFEDDRDLQAPLQNLRCYL